ncbi:transcription factor jumonji domain-containing protein [Asticcacaulis biprosthecium C19]|uniref:Transcription factor jumonji domain-containing protein n=1 Tax=Asticcacaulis biprosthecium C19 TaxID=715226 RepID=F4QTZ1_9CAUL|nr:transcription factor jumonji domain-containing protein [Asticcacaulis biprosthecium C19]
MAVYEGVDRQRFETEIQPRQRPALLRGLIGSWPAVAAAGRSPQALCDYFIARSTAHKVMLQTARPDLAGRFSFTDDLRTVNHQQRHLSFGEIAPLILRDSADDGAPTQYAGGIPVDLVMPKVLAENRLDLLDIQRVSQVSLWIGNRTRTAAHWDLPQNLACVIAGRRRFTLFPIDQIGNLYITPLDMTIAGQPTSLVDFFDPDFERFPRFRNAMAAAEVADMVPGDVLYMPSLWFHHVESLDSFGAMINFWWRDAAPYMTTPLLTLFHSLLTLRDMPLEERLRWRTLFDHYIFRPDGEAPLDHIPPAAHGLFSPMTPRNEQHLKAWLLQHLGRGTP